MVVCLYKAAPLGFGRHSHSGSHCSQTEAEFRLLTLSLTVQFKAAIVFQPFLIPTPPLIVFHQDWFRNARHIIRLENMLSIYFSIMMLSQAQQESFGTVVMVATTEEKHYMRRGSQCPVQCQTEAGLICFYQCCICHIFINTYRIIISIESLVDEMYLGSHLNTNQPINKYSSFSPAL